MHEKSTVDIEMLTARVMSLKLIDPGWDVRIEDEKFQWFQKSPSCEADFFGFWAILEFSSGRMIAKPEVYPIGAEDESIGLT